METLKDFYKYYKENLQGKYYCREIRTPDKYHFEHRDLGYDHLGHLGYETVKVIDSYKTVISRTELKRLNVLECVHMVVDGEGWIED